MKRPYTAGGREGRDSRDDFGGGPGWHEHPKRAVSAEGPRGRFDGRGGPPAPARASGEAGYERRVERYERRDSRPTDADRFSDRREDRPRRDPPSRDLRDRSPAERNRDRYR